MLTKEYLINTLKNFVPKADDDWLESTANYLLNKFSYASAIELNWSRDQSQIIVTPTPQEAFRKWLGDGRTSVKSMTEDGNLRNDHIIQNEEIRVVDPQSGGEKGAKLARFSLIPPDALWELALHYGRGARKYADRNWEKGYKWSLSVDALERHLTQFKMGEWLDEETGTPHIIAVAWHAFALFVFKVRGLGTNDINGGFTDEA